MGFLRRTISRFLPKSVRDALWYWRSKDLRLAMEAARQLKRRHGCVILAGPFRGMNYVETSFGSTYPPKLLGTYELELRDLLSRISGEPYGRIIDIGAAEGYYTVGLARMFPAARVVGYEMQLEAHPTLKQLAAANHAADRVVIKGICTADALREKAFAADAAGKTLLVSDCEGAEDFLLDPSTAPALLQTDLLIETHDFIVPGVTEKLRGRFAATHEVTLINYRERTLADWPKEADFVPEKYRLAAMAEHRGPGQNWLWLKRKS